MALRDVKAVVTITTNATKAIDDGKKLKETYKATLDIIKQFRKDGKIDTDEGKELLKLADDLQAKIKTLVSGMDLIRGVVDNLSNKSGKDLNRALREISKEFNKTGNETDADKKKLEELATSLKKIKDDQSIRKGLVMPLKEAADQLKNINNVSFDKLDKGLKAIREKISSLSTAELEGSTGQTLRNAERQYEAQIAVREYGRAGSADVSKMNNEQLRAEQQRLRSAYMATDGATGYETISNEYINRLQQVNQLLKERAEAQAKADKAARDAAADQEREARLQSTLSKLYNGQSVSLKELTEAYKTLKDGMEQALNTGGNTANAYRNDMKSVEDAMKNILTTVNELDINKVFRNLDTQSLETLEETLKKVKENAANVKVGDDKAIQQTAERMDILEKKITEVKERMAGLRLSTQEAANTLQSVYRGQKVPLDELNAAYKTLQARAESLDLINPKKAQVARQQMKVLEGAIKNVNKELLTERELQNRVANSGKYNVQQLQQAYDQLKYKLSTLNAEEKEAIKETRKQMERLKKTINEVNGEVTGLEKIWRTAVRNIATYVGVFAGFNYVKGKIMEIVRGNIQLSDSMAQVQKVTGLTKKEVDSLNESFGKLDTRTTLTQLNDLAYSAGKMGLGKYGVDGVRQFVEATNQLQVALGEDLGNSVDEAITPLAKLAENLGMIQKMGVEKSMLAIGSSINELSQTTTATGKNIVDFARRIQPSAQMIGLTTDEILALGSASDSFGIASEISATAFTKFLAAYRTNAAEIERILGLAKGTLDQYFDQGRTMEGMMAIFQRMHEIGDLRYLEEAFKALGSEGSRMFTTFGAFSKNIDMFKEHLTTSTVAFAEATSVTNEYNLVQETAAGIIERANNIWEKAFVNPEGVDTVKELAIAWKELTEELTGSASWMTGVNFALQSIATTLGIIVKLAPILIRALMFYGVAETVRKIWVQMTALNVSMATATTTAGKLSAVLKSNVWVLASTAIIFAVTALIDMAAASEKATKALDAVTDAEKKAAEESTKERAELKRLYEATKDTTKSIEERKEALRKMVGDEKYKQYKSDLSDEQVLAREAAKAYSELTDEIIKSAKARAYQQKITELTEKNIALEDANDEANNYLNNNKGRYEAGKQEYKNQQEYAGQVAGGAMAGFPESGIVQRGAAAMQPAIIGEYEQKQRDVISNQEAIAKNDADILKLEQKIKDLNTPTTTNTTNTTVPTTTGDGGGGSGTTKAPEWMVEEKKEAEKATRAIIGSIEEFYRLQEAAANELAANGQLKGADFDMLINHIQDRKDKMLLEARRAIVGDPNEFENIRKSLEMDIVKRDDAVSQAAMQRILEAEPAKQGANLRKYNGSDAVYGLDSNAYLNDIRKNAAQNELNIQRRQAKLVEEIDKFLLQYQFVEQAQRDFGDKLVKLGLVSDGYAKVVKQLADGTTITANTNEVNQLANKVSGMGSKLYGVDITNSEELARMTKYMMTDSEGNEEAFASIFPDYKKWLEQPEQYKNKMVALYELMIQYEGIYYDQIKKRDELQNKRIDSWWEHSDEKKQNDKAVRSVDQYAFQYNNFAENQGMGYMMGLTNDVNQDPEVLREKAILEAKMAIWQKAKEEREAGLISEEVYQQRVKEMQDQTMAYTEAVMANINKRIDRVKQFVKPVETAAKSIGQKLGDMIFNMESESQTWEEIWKNMALAVAESMLTMAGQYAQNAIVKASMNKAEETEEGAHATVMTMLGISEGAAKTIGTLGWLGIALIPVITSLLMGLLTSALSTKRDNGSTNGGKKVKLTSGMLTYDEGNVQSVVGDDGRVYQARNKRSLPDGVGIVKSPIATTVNGQQALVGERGPEIVIGRKTTRALMMNRPDILQALNTVDRGITTRRVRTFDEGNMSDLASVFAAAQGDRAAVQSDNSTSDQSPSAAERDAMLVQTMQQMLPLMQGMVHLLENPVAPEIAMYGENGLHKKMKKADAFYARYGD